MTERERPKDILPAPRQAERPLAVARPGMDEGLAQALRELPQALNEAQIAILTQRTPQKEIRHRPGPGGRELAYVEHGYVSETLNLAFGFNWDFEVMDKQILENEVIVQGRLSVRAPSGQVITKDQFGSVEIKRHAPTIKVKEGDRLVERPNPRAGEPVSIGGDLKAAGSDALKKCASLLGIALDLYRHDRDLQGATVPTRTGTSREVVEDSARRGEAQEGEEPAPTITHAQIRAVFAHLRRTGIAEQDIKEQMGISSFKELNRQEASQLIDWLTRQPNQEQGARPERSEGRR